MIVIFTAQHNNLQGVRLFCVSCDKRSGLGAVAGLGCNGGLPVLGGGDFCLGDMGSGSTSTTAGDEGVVMVDEVLSSLVFSPYTGFLCRSKLSLFCCSVIVPGLRGGGRDGGVPVRFVDGTYWFCCVRGLGAGLLGCCII